MSLSSNSYDFLDVIDLDSALKLEPSIENQEKKGKPLVRTGTPGKYISLDSISDDELHLVTRSLITPVSFQYDLGYTSDGQPFPRQHNKILYGNERSHQALSHRSESAAIFDRLNNDDDGFSIDFAGTDLKDFIDPDLLEGVISRPASRVPKYNDSLSRDHGSLVNRHDYNLPSTPADNHVIRHDIDKKTAVDRYKQHLLPSRNSKRHSMDAEVLMSLRRDSDALLQRRESLLRLRKFSEGITRQPGLQFEHSQLLEKDKMERQYNKYNSPIANISSTLRSTTITDEKYLKRMRSVSFPDHSQKNKTFNHHSNCKEISCDTKTPICAAESILHDDRYPKINIKHNQLQGPTYPSMPKEHHTRHYDTSTQLISGRKKSIVKEQDNKLHLASKTDDRQNRKSVTESAKTLLANVRQRRTDDKKEAYHRRSSLSYSNRELNTNTDRSKPTLIKTKTSIISPKSSINYMEGSTYSPKSLIDGDKIHVMTRSSRGETTDSRQNRRWSSSLPLSSNIYSTPTSLSGQNNDTLRSNKLKQTEKKYNYVAKKSALDRSKDRYVAMLGKPPPSK